MKLIIELDDDIAKGIRGENECEVEPREIVRSFQATIADAIAQSKPYDDSGDLISRSALMKAIGTMVEAEMPIDEKWALGLKHSLKVIDNAPTVEEVSVIEFKEPLPLVKAQKIVKTLSKRPQGEWYYNYQNGWHCSLCHETVKDMPTVMRKAVFNFCPNCGADMRKGGAK